MRVLMILTSHDQLGDTGEKTGFWLEEFAAPYYVLKDANIEIILASPEGGQPPLDPKSHNAEFQTAATKRFAQDVVAQQHLSNSVHLSTVKASDFCGLFFPGGHGPLWDLVKNADSIHLIEDFLQQNKPVAAVCHASAVLLNVKTADGTPIVKGKKITGFSNSEETAVGLEKVVPFLLEDALVKLGARYRKAEDWAEHVEIDGDLITGQNPASSEATAKALLKQLKH